jgi:hypothetical protein
MHFSLKQSLSQNVVLGLWRGIFLRLKRKPQEPNCLKYINELFFFISFPQEDETFNIKGECVFVLMIWQF